MVSHKSMCFTITMFPPNTRTHSSTSYRPFSEPWFSPVIMDLPFRTRGRDRARDRYMMRPNRHDYQARYMAAPRLYEYVAQKGGRPYENEGDFYDDDTALSPLRYDRGRRRSYDRHSDSDCDVRQPKIEYEKARQKLNHNLHATIKFLLRTITNFDKDTEKVKAYASKKVMNELWKAKIGYGDDCDEIDDAPDVNQVMQCSYSKMNTMGNKLRVILTKVIHATIEATDEEEKQAASLQQTKIHMQMACIDKIWPEIHDSKKRCESLVVELQQLAKIAEPNKEQRSQISSAYQDDENSTYDNNHNTFN